MLCSIHYREEEYELNSWLLQVLCVVSGLPWQWIYVKLRSYVLSCIIYELLKNLNICLSFAYESISACDITCNMQFKKASSAWSQNVGQFLYFHVVLFCFLPIPHADIHLWIWRFNKYFGLSAVHISYITEQMTVILHRSIPYVAKIRHRTFIMNMIIILTWLNISTLEKKR